MNQLHERIAQFRKMANDDPDNELGHFRLGQLLAEAGDHAEAAKSFDRTLELSPGFSKVFQLLGQSLMSPLHLFMWHVQLAFAGLVRRNLHRSRASSIRFRQVGLDLLTTRAGGVEVLAGVAGDLGLCSIEGCHSKIAKVAKI